MNVWDQRKRKRERQVRLMRRVFYAVLIVWGILGLVGLITVFQWIVGAVTGTGPRAYGQGVTRDPARPGVVSASGGTYADDPADGGDDPEGAEGAGPGTSGGPAGAGKNGGTWYAFSDEERAECRRLCREYPELLVLVNKETELDIQYDSRLRNICNGRLQASGRLYNDLVAMLAAANKAGYEYWIASAYRSRARQQELIDEDVQELMARGWSYQEALEETLRETMPAGHSEHETGLALDMLCSGNENMDISQAREAGNHWLVQHCAEYGFILRYPEDKEDITQIDYEPWHFRYVGREAAGFIMERHITLEEFWAGAAE